MKNLLKFITCGSVDDGKSTLIGHLLYDAKLIYADQKQSLELDSKVGSRSGGVDYSLLLDGLMAEREQGITIDVAYRYFSTNNRSFIVADTPGHEQYTRNMAVGASFADLAVVLIDARQGVLPQTKRHTRICSLMGIKHFVIAVNKMDLVRYRQEAFAEIEADYLHFISDLDVATIQTIPVSASEGDNITALSANTKWYEGPTLLDYLEQINVAENRQNNEFMMPVQRVVRSDHTFRGFQGQVEYGCISENDEITVLPSQEKANIRKIFRTDQQAKIAYAGQPVTIQLDREVDVSRGCVFTHGSGLKTSDMFTATVLWMDDKELVPGRNYMIKIGTQIISGMVMSIKHKIDINTGKSEQADRLFKNEIASCDIALANKVVFDCFSDNKALGCLIMIDRLTNMTSACGIIESPLVRADNIFWQKTTINREIRAKQKNQSPMTVWFTGLSGSGKSALANELEKRLVALGRHTMILDGDNIRHGLNKNLSFSEADRVENIRRIAEVARLLNEAGLIVLAAFISPYTSDRENARQIIGSNFFEIFVSTPLEVCEERDVKGLYKKAREGIIKNFTGISSPYEKPDNPDYVIDTSQLSLDEATDILYQLISPYLDDLTTGGQDHDQKSRYSRRRTGNPDATADQDTAKGNAASGG